MLTYSLRVLTLFRNASERLRVLTNISKVLTDNLGMLKDSLRVLKYIFSPGLLVLFGSRKQSLVLKVLIVHL